MPQSAHNQEQKNQCQSSLKAKAVLQWRKDKRQASVTADLYLSTSETTPDHVHSATSFVDQYITCRLHKKSRNIGETNRLRPKIDFDASSSARKKTKKKNSGRENVITGKKKKKVNCVSFRKKPKKRSILFVSLSISKLCEDE